MIRGPIQPPPRESLWKLVSTRLAALESGLALIQEGFECSAGEVGAGYVAAADALLRDAAGAPVFLLVAGDADAGLAGRVLATLSFCERMGDALSRALPEAGFVPGSAARVLVVGPAVALTPLDLLRRLEPRGLELCQLEPFRLGGVERCATRWLGGGLGGGASSAGTPLPAFHLPESLLPLWAEIERFLQRLDSSIVVDGDRFLRRISWLGRPLGRVHVAEGSLVATAPGGATSLLDGPASVRRWCDQLFRCYLTLAGAPAAPASANANRLVDPGGLRASLAGARVSAEEYAALGRHRRSEEGELDASRGADYADDRRPSYAGEASSLADAAPPD